MHARNFVYIQFQPIMTIIFIIIIIISIIQQYISMALVKRQAKKKL